MELRQEFIKDKKYSYFNNTVLNEYSLWLENKIKLLQSNSNQDICIHDYHKHAGIKGVLVCGKCRKTKFEGM